MVHVIDVVDVGGGARVFGHNKHLEEKLRAGGGVSAWATVLESEQQWASTGGVNKVAGQAGSMTIHQRIKLRVEPEGEPSFEGEVKQVFNDTHGMHIPQEGYSVGVLYDPKDHSKLVIDMDKMPVVPGADRDEVTARHERTMARFNDPEAHAAWLAEVKEMQDSARAQGAAAIEQAMRSFPAPQASAAPVDVADQLTKLAALRDRGVLSDAEFEMQKAKLLGES
jgi:hypothetical protein